MGHFAEAASFKPADLRTSKHKHSTFDYHQQHPVSDCWKDIELQAKDMP